MADKKKRVYRLYPPLPAKHMGAVISPLGHFDSEEEAGAWLDNSDHKPGIYLVTSYIEEEGCTAKEFVKA